MDEKKLRAWWWRRQGLDGTLSGAPAAGILQSAGWARSVGGVGPYLTLYARSGATREAVDAAAAELAIHELPAARGCTYVVAASDYALALLSGQNFADGDMKTARKLGVTDAEVDKLSAAVLKALKKGPLDPEGIRTAVGDAVRSLGEEGKKKGVTTTLPLALGRLQAAGEIRRISMNGRLDQQRYKYALWSPNPLAGSKLRPEEVYTELARRYFAWTAPATVAEFQWFAGLGVKAAQAAVAPLELVPLPDSEGYLLPRDLLKDFVAFRAPEKSEYLLLSNLDSLLLLRRNLSTLMDPADAARPLPGTGRHEAGGALTELPSPAIFDRGRLVGLWEYDPGTESIAWMSLIKPDAGLREAVARTEAFVRDQLGDARTFSLDSPKSRQPRIDALRAAQQKSSV